MNSQSDIDRQIAEIMTCKPLPEAELLILCEKAKQIFAQESNVVPVNAPVIVCGDIHGQFYDLMQLFSIGGLIPESNYLFMGDYVNRGILCLIKDITQWKRLPFSSLLKLLRGNHEATNISQVYGFYDECSKKYGSSNVWKCFTQVFNFLPLTALIENQIFCVHAGLSFSIDTLDAIKKINRFQDIPIEGPMRNLLWTDTNDLPGWHLLPQSYDFSFGPDITEQFIHKNDLKLIVRAHQLVLEGYEIIHNKKLTTIFSAPNYCYCCGNLAAIMDDDQNLQQNYIQFDPAPKSREKIQGKRSPDQ